MSEPHAYRASDELAAALRNQQVKVRAFDQRIAEFNRINSQHRLMGQSGGFSIDPHFTGFEDGTDEVPDGLSRAKTRRHLRPARGKAGSGWQAVLDDLNKNRPSYGQVYEAFSVPENAEGGDSGHGGFYVSATRWIDAGEDGVLVVNKYDLDGSTFGRHSGSRGPHLTPIPLSEFYAIKERLDAEREGVTS